MSKPILSIVDLETTFSTEQGDLVVLNNVSFDVSKGKTVGIVGESGCGKSVTAASIMGLLPRPYGKVTSGKVVYKEADLVAMQPHDLYQTRGNEISMIFQDPMTALNPVHTIGKQLCEVYRIHKPDMSPQEQKRSAIKMLDKVGIPDPSARFDVYPHELSGGMRQRVMIAIALACEPDVLIADEPTTALDVTVQAQILELMKKMQDDSQMAIILITHDMGVVAESCDEVVVMYAGNVVEKADVFTLFSAPKHPYTKGLLNSIPHLHGEPKTVLATIAGSVPHLTEMPSGCRFRNRCQHQVARCAASTPKLTTIADNHAVSCFLVNEVDHG